MKDKKLMLTVALLGTVLEWAEYTFYAYMATTISSLFFPQLDPRVGIIATFGIFAAGYLLRPIGALLFGYIGDVLGRKKALVISMFLMSVSTLAMGLLPTYVHIGILAPIFLICCRSIQGLVVQYLS